MINRLNSRRLTAPRFFLSTFFVGIAPLALAAEPPKPPAVNVSRADLAAAYLRLEQAYFAHPPKDEQKATINQAFDRATLAFFSGRYPDALRTIDGLTDSLRSTPASNELRAIVSLKVTIDPPVWTTSSPQPATAKITSLYDAPLPDATDLKLQLRLIAPGGKLAQSHDFSIRLGPKEQASLSLPLHPLSTGAAPGLYRVELASAAVAGTAGFTLSGGRGSVTAGAAGTNVSTPGITVARVNLIEGQSLSAQREANEKRLAACAPVDPALIQALAICQARNRLLSDKPSEGNSAQFLADLNGLAAQVAAETEAILAGKNPYHHRAGDHWRVVTDGATEIPVRVYAPAAAVTDEPRPLLIVLHGAGADENMFLEAYGAGLIKKIADEKGLLVASPLTYKFSGNPQRVAQLVEKLSHDYAIDRQRVYLLGHSMGASATANLTRGRTDLIAAACCIAGGNSFRSDDGIPPTLVVVAELDAVVPPKSVEGPATKAKEAGMPIELRVMPAFGHTLVVGSVLPSAVEWLLTHQLSKKPAS